MNNLKTTEDDVNREMLKAELQKRFGMKLLFCKKDLALILDKSLASIDRDIANKTGIEYIKNGPHGNVTYPLHCILQYLTQTIKTKN